MKKCIWCNKSEGNETFAKKAHTFPQSLGGKSICENVCDSCNHFFGSPQYNSPAVEVVLKEILNISKYLLLNQTGGIPKNKRFKSEFFNINWDKKTITIKPRYNIKKGFQENLGRLFRRGLYKVFLEERERQKKDAHNENFNFIREFSRYNLGEYPIYILKPKFGVIMMSQPDIVNPMIRFTDHSDDLNKSYRIFEYMIMGHTFCIPTSRNFKDFCLDSYIRHLHKDDGPFGKELIEIKYAENVDFTFKYMKK